MEKKLNLNYVLLLVAILLPIMTQAQLYWEDDFSSSNWKNNYDINGSQNFVQIPGAGPGGNGCVEVTIKKGSHLGGSVRYLFKQKLGFEPEEVYAEYRVRYDSDMRAYGGKGPGFSGTYDRSGWGNRPGYGKAGWSARGNVNCDRQPYTRNSWYVYHTYTNYDASNCPGSTNYRSCNPFPYDVANPGAQPHASKNTWGSGLNWGSKGNMQFNEWYHVKQYVKLNTPGQNNGILRVWVNGEMANQFTNVNFRRDNSLKVYAYWFNYYNGGPNTIRETGHVRIDDFKLYGPNGIGNSAPNPAPEPTPNPTPAPAPPSNNGNVQSIPGKIESETWSVMNGVRKQATSDTGGGQNVAYIDQGDWMDYRVNVANAGSYTVKFRVASSSKDIVLQLRKGNTVLTNLNTSTTGNWQSFKTVAKTVNLSSGNQTLRILATGGGWNINWVEFTRNVGNNSSNASCTYPEWQSGRRYVKNNKTSYNGKKWNWRGNKSGNCTPGNCWRWQNIGSCGSSRDAGKLDEANSLGLFVYPNPVLDAINIDSREQDITELIIFDINGKLLYNSGKIEKPVSKFKISVLDIKASNSIVFLKVITKGKAYVKKLKIN